MTYHTWIEIVRHLRKFFFCFSNNSRQQTTGRKDIDSPNESNRRPMRNNKKKILFQPSCSIDPYETFSLIAMILGKIEFKDVFTSWLIWLILGRLTMWHIWRHFVQRMTHWCALTGIESDQWFIWSLIRRYSESVLIVYVDRGVHYSVAYSYTFDRVLYFSDQLIPCPPVSWIVSVSPFNGSLFYQALSWIFSSIDSSICFCLCALRR